MEEPEAVRYAGFWVRFWATVIDVVLISAVILPLLVWAYGLQNLAILDRDALLDPNQLEKVLRQVERVLHGPMGIMIQYVLPTVALIVFWKYKSATPGKMVFSMKIVDARSGGGLSFGQCVGRYFAYIVSMLPFGLGFLWIAFDKRKQAWHDKLAGTVVVRK
jgi:uncharacterized RDD family membrane protein YckC